jgi:hypothetical protein
MGISLIRQGRCGTQISCELAPQITRFAEAGVPTARSSVKYGVAVLRDTVEVDQKIYGTTIVPFLKLKTATTITTISAGTTLNSFIAK